MRLALHHIGIVVKDIDREAETYVKCLGYKVVSPVIHDPVQTARVCFLKLPNDAVYLELVTPDGPDSKLSRAAGKGGGLNHLCYHTDDIDQACARMRESGMFPLQPPVAASAFPGRCIAWLMGRNGIPIELVQAGRDEWQEPGLSGGAK